MEERLQEFVQSLLNDEPMYMFRTENGKSTYFKVVLVTKDRTIFNMNHILHKLLGIQLVKDEYIRKTCIGFDRSLDAYLHILRELEKKGYITPDQCRSLYCFQNRRVF